MIKRTIICPVAFVYVLCFFTEAYSRDIDLDAIYLNSTSPYYSRLLEKKITAYQAVNSQLIDRDVSFASWADGFNIIYIRELPDLNIVCLHNRKTQTRTELLRLGGTITAAKTSLNGRYLYVKRFRNDRNLERSGETIVFEIRSRKANTLESNYPFIDFSLSSSGNEVLYETGKGIVEYFPDTRNKNIILGRNEYSDIISAHSPTIAYMSPNRKKMLLVNGSGGSYAAKIISHGRSYKLHGVSSCSEIFWINNNQVAFRKGNSGNYTVNMHDVESQRTTVLGGRSLNTNLQFSCLSKMVSFLQDQVIQLYDVRRNAVFMIGLEGEDLSFSPDGSKFISLYLKKLFLSDINQIKKKNLELVKNSTQIRDLYKNILDSRGDWLNEYTPEYLRKKISVYARLAE